MITWPWIAARSNSALDLDEFPDLKAWQTRVGERAAVQRALERARDFAGGTPRGTGDAARAAQSVLFNQRARR
jgi:hypothetical protein